MPHMIYRLESLLKTLDFEYKVSSEDIEQLQSRGLTFETSDGRLLQVKIELGEIVMSDGIFRIRESKIKLRQNESSLNTKSPVKEELMGPELDSSLFQIPLPRETTPTQTGINSPTNLSVPTYWPAKIKRRFNSLLYTAKYGMLEFCRDQKYLQSIRKWFQRAKEN